MSITSTTGDSATGTRSFPLVEAFLAKLPEGAASYPQCQSRGISLSIMLDRFPVEVGDGSLPPEVVAILRNPPRGPWVATAPYHAAMLALREVHFPVGPEGERRLLAELERNTREIFGSARFRVLFGLTSPERMLVTLARRWSAFHRGASLAVIERQSHAAILSLRHPMHLHLDFADFTWGQAFAIALERSGAERCAFEVERMSPARAHYHLRWE